MRKRHYLEREELLQVALIGAAIADRDVRGRLVASQFSEPYAAVLTALQEGSQEKPDLIGRVKRWAETHLGVSLRDREPLIEGMERRLVEDATHRKWDRQDKMAGVMARWIDQLKEQINGAQEQEQRETRRA